MFDFISKLFSGKQKPPSPGSAALQWNLHVRGEITALKQTNIDKSGRHPRFVIYGTISVADFDLEGADFEVPSEINFQGPEKEILQQTTKPLVIGEQVSLHFGGTDAPTGRYVITNA